MEYLNFDLWIDQKSETTYSLRADSEDSGFGQARGALERDYIYTLNEGLSRLDQRETDRDFLIDFGTELYTHLFKDEIHSLFEQSYGAAWENPDAAIRLRLRIDPPDIAALPWEFLYSPTRDCFLGTSVRSALVRYLELKVPTRKLEAKLPLRILAVIPNSVEPYPELDAEVERENLEEALRDLRDSVQLHFLEGNVTPTRISDKLLEQPYHCFHYIGHGHFDEKGFLVLNTEDRLPYLVDDQHFASLFRNHDTMKLVVLNSCKGASVSHSKPLVGMAPQLVKLGIPAVVAMQYAISDEVAVRFAREFYRSLFKGSNKGRVEAAMSHARNRLVGEFPNDRDIGSPVLFMHTKHGILFDPVKGNLLKDMPLSRGELQTAKAVIDTHEHNLTIASDDEQRRNDREELRRLRQRTKLRNYTLITASLVVLLMFCLSLVGIFQAVRLDTSIESLTMWLGDMFREKTFAEEVVMVYFSEDTMEGLNPGLRREKYTELIDKLSQTERRPKVIVFDMLFEFDTSLDEEFTEIISRAEELGTSIVVGISDIKGDNPNLADNLRAVVTGYGATCIGKKWYARTVPLAIFKEGNGYIPSLALKAVEAYRDASYRPYEKPEWNSRRIKLIDQKSQESESFGISELTLIRSERHKCQVLDKGDLVADVIVDTSPRAALDERLFEYKDVMAFGPDEFACFDGKIVMVGRGKLEDTHDVYRVSQRRRYGFELHADATSTILQKVTIRPAGVSEQFLVMLFLGVLGALIQYRLSKIRRYWRIGLWIGVVVVYLAFTVFTYSRYLVILNTVYHVGTFCLAYWVAGKMKRRYFS